MNMKPYKPLFYLTLGYPLTLLLLSGCTSLQYAGATSTTLKPIKIDGEVVCCEFTYTGGKEIQSARVRVEKRGSDYTFELDAKGIEAFKGQAISADAIPSVIPLP